MKLLQYLAPRIKLRDLPPMLLVAAAGAVLTGIYGVLHDQVTYTISPEYFTHMKFKQFHYADFGLGPRFFAGVIGFLATWWVGMFMGWFIARRLIPRQPRKRAYRQIARAFLCVFLTGVCFTTAGYLYGLWLGPDADYSAWRAAFSFHRIQHQWAFVRVAHIHTASYLGGVVGFVLALLLIKPKRDQGD